MFLVIGLILIALALLGLLNVIALSLTVSIVLAIVGVVLIVLDRRGIGFH